jgi:hypothetical protein
MRRKRIRRLMRTMALGPKPRTGHWDRREHGRTIDRFNPSPEGRIELCQCAPRNLSNPALSSSLIAKSKLFQISHLIAMLECLLLPERALKEGKTFSDMANELVEIGLFDLTKAEE